MKPALFLNIETWVGDAMNAVKPALLPFCEMFVKHLQSQHNTNESAADERSHKKSA